MTEKLYYEDAYISEFSARVISSTPTEGGFDTILDRTAFFPEEGGQSSDGGIIAGATVIRVYEENGVIHHLTDRLVETAEVFCKIDFSDRFVKMQLQ